MITLKPNRGWEGLPQISKYMYQDTYFLPGETYDGWVNRMCTAYTSNTDHFNRMSAYLRNYWFHPSTPPSGNGGTDKGLPISCYVGDVEDSKEGIFNSWSESGWLGSQAGGIGRSWSAVRELGATVGSHGGKSSGVIPFMKVDDSLSMAVSQGDLRRMSQADYLSISHPEIEEFIEIRKPTGDQNRKALSLHHGVVIPDAFMNAVIADQPWNLISPKTNRVIKTVQAKTIWNKILDVRATTGEPYLMFYDTVNRNAPAEYKTLGLDIHLSNLCSEIMLNTSPTKTNVCCLASINLEYWDEFKPNLQQFVGDCIDFLDNILQDFIDKTEGKPGFENARQAAIDERALGLGVMGFHSLLQSKHIPFESSLASGLNKSIFSLLRSACDSHQDYLASQPNFQPCPMSALAGTNKRNIVSMAVAPTMSISNLCNLTSSGIEPWMSNTFSKKLKQGTFAIINKYLLSYIDNHAAVNQYTQDWIDQQMISIKKAEGSVQHLDWMDDYTKDVFKAAHEIDQRWVVAHAGDRSTFIDQGQSVNLFIPGNSHVQDIADIHIYAWKQGLKSLYYLRSTNPNRASTANKERKTAITYDECLSCQ